jgi:hypothetical protein
MKKGGKMKKALVILAVAVFVFVTVSPVYAQSKNSYSGRSSYNSTGKDKTADTGKGKEAKKVKLSDKAIVAMGRMSKGLSDNKKAKKEGTEKPSYGSSKSYKSGR